MSLPEIALEGIAYFWLGGFIKSFGIGSILPSPKLLLVPTASADGSIDKLERCINETKTSALIIPIVAKKQESPNLAKLYNV